MHYKMREAANRAAYHLFRSARSVHFAPPSRDFFVGQPNGRIGRFLR